MHKCAHTQCSMLGIGETALFDYNATRGASIIAGRAGARFLPCVAFGLSPLVSADAL